MRHKNKKESGRKLREILLGMAMLFIAFYFSLSFVSAQENINASGGDASGSGGSVSYSVGQVVYQTYAGTNGSVAQGVQQPYEISVVTTIDEAKGISLSITAYPNPTTDYLTLSIDKSEVSNLSYQLYDMQGKLLKNEKISGNQTKVAMSNLLPAVYFVKISECNKQIKVFKIIKN